MDKPRSALRSGACPFFGEGGGLDLFPQKRYNFHKIEEKSGGEEMIQWIGGGPGEFRRGRQAIGIVELADLFGITKEALRKYEGKNVLQPYRDESGYRKYSTWDLTKLVRVRQLRQEGFPLTHIAGEMEAEDPNRQIRDLEGQREELRREIAYREKLIRWLGSRQEEIAWLEELGDRLVIQEQERRYCCVYMVGNALVDKRGEAWEDLKKWIQALPFAQVCYIGSGDNDTTLSCLTVTESIRAAYGLEGLTADFVIPAGRYVVCSSVAEHSLTRDTSVESTGGARRRAEELGLALGEWPVVQMVWFSQREGLFRSHNKAMFPIVEGNV